MLKELNHRTQLTYYYPLSGWMSNVCRVLPEEVMYQTIAFSHRITQHNIDVCRNSSQRTGCNYELA